MDDTEEKKTNGYSCNCCGGKTKWIWMVLAVVAGVVVFGKLAGNGPSACCGGGICPLPPVVTSSNAGGVAQAPATEGACCGGRAAVVVGGREIGTPQAIAPTNGAPEQRLPRLVDLGAGKCIPCKLMAPILEELKSNCVGRLDVQFIDVWQNPDAGKPYQIRMIPTQVFIGTNGNEVFRHEGFFSKEDILAKWKELGVNLK